MQDNNLKLTFASHGPDLLDVRQFSVHESMNELFEVSVLAHSEDDNIDLDSIVGKGAAFTLETQNYKAGSNTRIWAGVVAHMSQVHAERAPGHSAYHVVVVPTLWRATLRRQTRIHRSDGGGTHVTTPDVVKKLLSEYEITPVLKLQAQYKKHEIVVQYGESDYAFICRLLEEAGISFYFENVAENGKGENVTKLVLSDAPHLNPQREGKLSYAGHQTPRFGGDEDFCATVTLTQRMKPGRFTVRDFDFRLSPETPLFANSKSGTREDVYEQYDYAPGAFWWDEADKPVGAPADDKGPAGTNKEQSETKLKRDLGAERRRRLLVGFHTNAIDLGPGKIVGINQNSDNKPHPRDDLAPGKKLLLVSTALEGEHNGEWSMTASGVYAEFPYKPERRTPKPRIYGVQSALVVGPKGSDIHVDQFGRVRVQFHWDREGKYDDNSSCWIRVSHPWAGGAFGVINIPRVGHEVLVEFFEGDPDLPVIVGRVYNAKTNVPYKLPDNATQSGWKTDSSPGGGGFNEIRFEDKKGQEEIHFQAQKDISYVINNNETSDIGNARTHTVGSTDSLHVGNTRHVVVGHNNTTHVGDYDAVSVGPTTGIRIHKEKKIVLTTGDASITLDGKNVYMNATGEVHIHSGKVLHISSEKGTVEVQGGPNVRINDGSKGPAPKVDTIEPAVPPSPPKPGEISGPPYKPSGGTTVDKPGPVEDVNLGGGEEQKEGSSAKKSEEEDKKGPPAKPATGPWVDSHHKELGQALVAQKEMLETKKKELDRWNADDKAHVKKYFGNDDEATRKTLQDRIGKELKLNEELRNDKTFGHFKDVPADKSDNSTFAYVYPDDKTHTIYLDKAFQRAPLTGTDSRAGTLIHEMSHFKDIAGTKDNVYGNGPAQNLATKDPAKALGNADSFEYFNETSK